MQNEARVCEQSYALIELEFSEPRIKSIQQELIKIPEVGGGGFASGNRVLDAAGVRGAWCAVVEPCFAGLMGWGSGQLGAYCWE